MSDQSRQSRPMKLLDWLIVALVVFAFLLPVFAIKQIQKLDAIVNGFAIVGCVLMLLWMWRGDGAHSRIWNWLPPFWPWGRTLKGSISRWALVLFMIAGTACGVVLGRISK